MPDTPVLPPHLATALLKSGELLEGDLVPPLLVVGYREGSDPMVFQHQRVDDEGEAQFVAFLREVGFPRFGVTRYAVVQLVEMEVVRGGSSDAPREAVFLAQVDQSQFAAWLCWVHRNDHGEFTYLEPPKFFPDAVRTEGLIQLLGLLSP